MLAMKDERGQIRLHITGIMPAGQSVCFLRIQEKGYFTNLAYTLIHYKILGQKSQKI